MGWDYNSHIVCMCIIMRWSQNGSASWAERFRTSSLLCTYKLCGYYTHIPILSPFLFTPSLYAPILNLQDFSFTCIQSTTVLCDIIELCTCAMVNHLRDFLSCCHIRLAHCIFCIEDNALSFISNCMGSTCVCMCVRV